MTLKVLNFERDEIINNRPRLFSDLPFFENVLLLQGPVGPFFAKLRDFLVKKGSRVFKIHFNYGDVVFYQNQYHAYFYQGINEEWEDYIFKFYKQKNIQAVFLIGDKRNFHHTAIQVAKRLGIKVYVFEEGYIRPNYFTLEENGVNIDSPLAQIDPLNIKPVNLDFVEKEYRSFVTMCWYGIKYWFFSYIFNYKFKNYKHHKNLNLLKVFCWIRGFFRFLLYELSEFHLRRKLYKDNRKYFLCILQVHDDFQITHNSTFANIEEFIEKVIYKFNNFIKEEFSQDILIIKHHPMDIGEKNYANLIKQIAKKLKMNENQIIYIHNFKIENIFHKTKGAIMINSTLGLKMLKNNISVINLSKSFYHKHGLTFQGDLNEFFKNPIQPDKQIVNNYISHLIVKSQVNGTLYAKDYEIN